MSRCAVIDLGDGTKQCQTCHGVWLDYEEDDDE